MTRPGVSATATRAWPTPNPKKTIRTFTTGPPPREDSEYVLDQVRYPDYYLDMRTVGQPARAWLDRRRPVRSIGSDYPEPEDLIALGRTYDVLVHLRRITAGRLRGTSGPSPWAPTPSAPVSSPRRSPH